LFYVAPYHIVPINALNTHRMNERTQQYNIHGLGIPIEAAISEALRPSTPAFSGSAAMIPSNIPLLPSKSGQNQSRNR
jgi:hypothetical protein